MRLVLLPGLYGTGELFAPLMAELSGALSAIIVPLPADGPQTYESLADRLADRLEAGRRVVLLGESFSGPLAVTLCRRAPELVAGLVLSASFVTGPRPRWLAHLPLRLLLGAGSRGAFARNAHVGMGLPPALVEVQERALRRVGTAVLATRLREALRCDVRAELRDSACPLLLLEARRDRMVGLRARRKVRRARPDATVVSIDSGHFVLQEQPAAAAAAIESFLDSIRETPAGARG